MLMVLVIVVVGAHNSLIMVVVVVVVVVVVAAAAAVATIVVGGTTYLHEHPPLPLTLTPTHGIHNERNQPFPLVQVMAVTMVEVAEVVVSRIRQTGESTAGERYPVPQDTRGN